MKQMSCVSQGIMILIILNLHSNHLKLCPSAHYLSGHLSLYMSNTTGCQFPLPLLSLEDSAANGHEKICGWKEGSIIYIIPLRIACRQEYVMEAKGSLLCHISGGTNWFSSSLKQEHFQKVLGMGRIEYFVQKNVRKVHFENFRTSPCPETLFL